MPSTGTTIRNIGKAEFMSIFHQYQGESLCAKKLGLYSNQCQDPTMKSIITQMGAQCQERANHLATLLQQSGGSKFLS
ncbi:MAG TPA: hypothetical protein GXZ24_02560 [Firmicutes bacterium]|nr:hypothetical protein [Bacillota bacterium]